MEKANMSMENLLQKAQGSLFKLCNMAAMRATELNAGMKKLVDGEINEKVTTTALKEIAEGKVTLKKGKG